MSHSTKREDNRGCPRVPCSTGCGAKRPIFAPQRRSFKKRDCFWQEGEHEYALAPVCGADVRSSKAGPARVVPERGQIAEYSAEPPAAECGDVLQEDELGS